MVDFAARRGCVEAIGSLFEPAFPSDEHSASHREAVVPKR